MSIKIPDFIRKALYAPSVQGPKLTKKMTSDDSSSTSLDHTFSMPMLHEGKATFYTFIIIVFHIAQCSPYKSLPAEWKVVVVVARWTKQREMYSKNKILLWLIYINPLIIS